MFYMILCLCAPLSRVLCLCESEALSSLVDREQQLLPEHLVR